LFVVIPVSPGRSLLPYTTLFRSRRRWSADGGSFGSVDVVGQVHRTPDHRARSVLGLMARPPDVDVAGRVRWVLLTVGDGVAPLSGEPLKSMCRRRAVLRDRG